jgi:acetyl-CoA C-acetyltransferase
VYIVGACRTPVGAFLGALAPLTAPKLGALVIAEALHRAKIDKAAAGEVVMGNVLSAGVGQAPARQASLAAGLPLSVPCVTVNKVCGSGLYSVVMGTRSIALGDADVVVAGGMESMSNSPYYLTRARSGYRMGDAKLVDGMIYDGLWDPYNDFHMGNAGEICAREFQLTRQMQDEFARESYRRALAATASGAFRAEILPVRLLHGKGPPETVNVDEEPGRGDPARFDKLRPAFQPDGTITAANASSLSDGAAAVVLASERAVKEHSLKPLARVVGYGGAAQAPEWFTTAPAKAMESTLGHLGMTKNDIDLWEINEAFSCVTMACSRLVELDPAKVNVHGGAVALGHPIGASGARLLVTLLHAMQQQSAKRGLCTLCIGGGEAVAVVVERA